MQTKNFTFKLKMLLQMNEQLYMHTKNIYLEIKYSTCKLQIVLQIENTTVHANLKFEAS